MKWLSIQRCIPRTMDELLHMWSSFVKRKFQSNIAILMLSFGHGMENLEEQVDISGKYLRLGYIDLSSFFIVYG